MMHFIGSTGIYVEGYSHLLHTFFYQSMKFIYHLLRRNAFLHSTYGDGHTMLIAATNKFYISFLCP